MYLLPRHKPSAPDSEQSADNSLNATPEEAVRQWCVFELMRAYGVMISDLEFEHSVRIGSKRYRIDILIWRDGTPWAVVECKKTSHTKHKDALEQAKSYAAAEGIRAEYAIYTNGTDWLVSRQMHQHWVAVPDIPQRIDRHVGVQLDQVMRGLEDAGPLLYKLDDVLEKTEAHAFLIAMQRFFHGQNILTQDVDSGLCFAADNLLRVLISKRQHPNYRTEKFLVALRSLERYRANTHLGGAIYVPEQLVSLDTEFRSLRAELYESIEGMQDRAEPNALVWRIVAALTDYGMSRSRRTSYPRISQVLHHAVRDFLDYSVRRYLTYELPNVADTYAVSDLKSHFSSDWGSCMAEAIAD